MNQAHQGSAACRVAGIDFGTDPGSLHSFEAIYDGYYDVVARWIRGLGGPTADRDDLIQEVFLVVYRRLPDFDGRNLMAWLYRITTHQVRDYRRLIWIRHIFSRRVEVSPEMPSIRPTPLMTLETRERQQRLEWLLSRLGDQLRAAFVLFEIEGYTAEEIGDMQAVSVNTVRARIHRARKRMGALAKVTARRSSAENSSDRP
jgi:RNA polymerase sigma-70 factor, ECF subfamily